jgi:hypothetical protein
MRIYPPIAGKGSPQPKPGSKFLLLSFVGWAMPTITELIRGLIVVGCAYPTGWVDVAVVLGFKQSLTVS